MDEKDLKIIELREMISRLEAENKKLKLDKLQYQNALYDLYDKHLRVMIGETLVDESKRHISAEQAITNIRKYMQEADFKRAKLEVEHE